MGLLSGFDGVSFAQAMSLLFETMDAVGIKLKCAALSGPVAQVARARA
jgi:hypothetical protein